MTNSVDPDQTAPSGTIRYGFKMFVQTSMSKTFGFLQYMNLLPPLSYRIIANV